MELEKFGVVEINATEQQDENGGFLYTLAGGLISNAIGVAACVGVVVVAGYAIYAGFEYGYQVVQNS
ncbi:MAG: hypothetical protein WBJ36_01175 [Tenuifilum sp.]|uniref:hypothetical protein n=1 Tax=Tenuifilum sp. TaxID=2760880 RepID=UPI001B6EF32E|nr:hypothetical protein [Bacteroidales bacterium]HOK60073.1 hypothetical protein [Tenuifilum sp.]MBP9028370.1 hypothetical protein [Bacteroidales bacterium]HOK86136.1 hypothetical protein [Tenuifilum sp.]HON71155.1 hypothetical protein [Tenuifilum sp.]